jgi:hypothetical protein
VVSTKPARRIKSFLLSSSPVSHIPLSHPRVYHYQETCMENHFDFQSHSALHNQKITRVETFVEDATHHPAYWVYEVYLIL